MTKISAKVMNWMSSRPGSGSPASVCSGSESAAASDTAPRIPAQPPTMRVCHEPRRATCDGRRSMARMSIVTTKLQAKRTPMTAAHTAAA